MSTGGARTHRAGNERRSRCSGTCGGEGESRRSTRRRGRSRRATPQQLPNASGRSRRRCHIPQLPSRRRCQQQGVRSVCREAGEQRKWYRQRRRRLPGGRHGGEQTATGCELEGYGRGARQRGSTSKGRARAERHAQPSARDQRACDCARCGHCCTPCTARGGKGRTRPSKRGSSMSCHVGAVRRHGGATRGEHRCQGKYAAQASKSRVPYES